MKRIFLPITLALAAFTAAADGLNDSLAKWIQAQAGMTTWSADFKQTRELKALNEPLVATGKLWVSLPDKFRWEVQKPAPTIAVRDKDELTIIYPKLHRAERYSLTKLRVGPWKDLMSLLDTGFPRSREEFEARFKIKSIGAASDAVHVVLEPTSVLAKKYLPDLSIDFATADLSLRATDLKFIDGSSLKTEFTNPKLNAGVDDELFHPKLGPEYQVRGDEPFLRGHFPGNPIFPGVLLVEAAAQLAGCVAQSDPSQPQLQNLKLAGIKGGKITGTARPGETLQITATLITRMANLIQASATVSVNGKIILQTEVILGT